MLKLYSNIQLSSSHDQRVNSLVPGICGNNLKSVISENMFWVTFMWHFLWNSLRSMTQKTFDDKPKLVQEMALVPSGNTPLSKPKLIQIYVAIRLAKWDKKYIAITPWSLGRRMKYLRVHRVNCRRPNSASWYQRQPYLATIHCSALASLIHWPLGDLKEILIKQIETYFRELWLGYDLWWSCP